MRNAATTYASSSSTDVAAYEDLPERMTAKSQFPHWMRNAATTYASSASTDVAAYEDLPDHHLLAVRNLIATTNDKSYHGSASELPPHNLTWVCGVGLLRVPDPVMF
jgi:hypothetical protein